MVIVRYRIRYTVRVRVRVRLSLGLRHLVKSSNISSIVAVPEVNNKIIN